MIRLLIVFAVSAPALGCFSDPTIDGCVGELIITVTTPDEVPENLAITFSGLSDTYINECEGPASSPLLVYRNGRTISVNDGGFGYRVPSSYSITIEDLGDCSGPPVLWFEDAAEVPQHLIEEHPDGNYVCSSATIAYPAR